MIKSFIHALEGGKVVVQERNFRVHLIAAILILALGYFVGIKRVEFVILFLTIGVVWSAEAFNTAIELVCDKMSASFDHQIKVIKDVAAFAVLILAGMAILVGMSIFLPYLV